MALGAAECGVIIVVGDEALLYNNTMLQLAIQIYPRLTWWLCINIAFVWVERRFPCINYLRFVHHYASVDIGPLRRIRRLQIIRQLPIIITILASIFKFPFSIPARTLIFVIISLIVNNRRVTFLWKNV